MSAVKGHLVTHRTLTHPDVIVGQEKSSAVKVWQPWIRALHWTLVASIVTLSITGFYIGNPLFDAGPRWNLMSTARTIHLIVAWVLIAVVIGRLFLAFTGNPWARWDQFVPVRSERRAALKHMLRYYCFLEKEPASVVGHNPVAGLSYLALFGLLAAQIMTGVALMAAQDNMGGWQAAMTGWFLHIFTPPQQRFIHHVIMWLIWIFVVMHLYASTLSDRIERSGEISSMIGGWKIMPRRRVDAELRLDTVRRRRRYLGE